MIMLELTRKPRTAMKDMSRSAITISFIIMLSCVATLGGYSIYQADQLNQQTEDIYAHPFIVSNALRDISIQVLSMRSNMQDIPFAKADEMETIIASMQEKEKKVIASFDVVLGAFLGDKQEIEKTKQIFIDWAKVRQKIITVAKNGERKKAHAYTQGFGLQHVTKLRARIQSHINYANAKAELFRKSSSELKKTTRNTSISLSLLIFLVSFFSLLFISRRYSKHALEIRAYAEDIKHGEDK